MSLFSPMAEQTLPAANGMDASPDIPGRNITERNWITMESLNKLVEEYSGVLLTSLWHILLALVIFLVGRRLIDALLNRISLLGDKYSHLDCGLRKFIYSMVKVGLWALLIYLIAYFIGVPTASFVAVIGSIGVTVGLALQGSLSNFASGVLLLFLHPFRVGDYIQVGEHKGTVTDIGLFYTCILTLENRTVSIPNGSLAGGNIINWSANKTNLLIIPISISYGSDIQKAIDVLTEVMNRREKVLNKEQTCVVVDSLGESSIGLQLRCWVALENYFDEQRAITRAAKEALDAAGVKIPFNQLDVHIIP